MPLPSLSKTWQFNVNQTVAASGTQLTNNRSSLRAIKDSLLGFGSTPWTTRYSCDSVAAGSAGDGVDRWDSNADLVWSAAGAQSWYILKQAGISSNFQIGLFLNVASSNGTLLTLSFSPNAGYTGGTTTAKPTATDEVTLISQTNWGGNNVDVQQRIHVMQSTDGQCTRIMMCDTGVFKMMWMFDKPGNPVTGWSNPSITLALASNSSTDVLTTANLSSAANVRGFGSASMSIFLTSEARNTTQLKSVFTVANSFSGEFPFFPIGLSSETASHVGRHGTVQDLWFGLSSLADGDTYPNDVSRQFMQAGELIVPWSGAVPGLT